MAYFRAACLLLGLLSCSVQADSIRLVTGDDYLPYTSRELPHGGLVTLLVHKAFEHRGIPTTLRWQPWKRGYLQTQRGKYDATFPYIVSPTRQRLFHYSAPLYTGEQYIFSRAGERIDRATEASLSGKRFCYPLGWQAPALLDQLVAQGKLQRHSPAGTAECAQLLLLGRDDFFLAERRTGEMVLQNLGAAADQFSRSREPINRNALHLVIPKSHPDGKRLMDEFNLGLNRMKATGEYQRLIDDYLRLINPRAADMP